MVCSGRCGGVRFGRPVPMLALVLTAQDVWWGLSRRLIPRRGRDGRLARVIGSASQACLRSCGPGMFRTEFGGSGFLGFERRGFDG